MLDPYSQRRGNERYNQSSAGRVLLLRCGCPFNPYFLGFNEILCKVICHFGCQLNPYERCGCKLNPYFSIGVVV